MKDDRLQAIDTLIDHLKTALTDQDWDELSRLNQLVRPTIEPLMAALEAGELQSEPVRERLAQLQSFCDRANNSANEARTEAQRALEGVSQNRSAAKAYQKVSLTPPK